MMKKEEKQNFIRKITDELLSIRKQVHGPHELDGPLSATLNSTKDVGYDNAVIEIIKILEREL